MKETWIGASSSILAKSKEASKAARYLTNKPVSYANVAQGATGGVHSRQLKGWRSLRVLGHLCCYFRGYVGEHPFG